MLAAYTLAELTEWPTRAPRPRTNEAALRHKLKRERRST